jgi:hypothetical protein
VRPAHAEKKQRAAAAKRILKVLNPAARAAYAAMEIGAEAVVFGPDGEIIHLRRDGELRFIVQELEDTDAAASVAMRWREEERAAEAIQ